MDGAQAVDAAGLGPNGFNFVPLGSPDAQIAALKTHQVAARSDGHHHSGDAGDRGRDAHPGRFGAIIHDYINHVIYASNDMIGAKHPDDVKKFLAGWFESVAYFKAAQGRRGVRSRRAVQLHKPEAIVSRVYDEATPMITDNGRFDAKGPRDHPRIACRHEDAGRGARHGDALYGKVFAELTTEKSSGRHSRASATCGHTQKIYKEPVRK